MHRFYGSLRRIRNFPTGRCRHRPLHSSRRLHLLFTIFRAEQARQGEAYHHAVHKNPLSAKAVTEVTLMANDETFRYDPTPMNHAFPGQPDDCFDMVNQYGTYNIQKTADTPTTPILPLRRGCRRSVTSRAAARQCSIWQAEKRKNKQKPAERIALRRLCVYSHVCHTSGQYPAVACLPLRTMGVFISSWWSKSLSSFARLSSV